MINEQKETENIHRLLFLPNKETCFKIFEYIAIYANNMQIMDIVQISKINHDLTPYNYWLVFIQADKACFKKLQNYLEE